MLISEYGPLKTIFFTVEKTSEFIAECATSVLFNAGFKKKIIIDITPNAVCTDSLKISIHFFHNVNHHRDSGKDKLILKSDTEINSMVLNYLK